MCATHVSRQFYYFTCQFLLQHHAVLITLVLQYILISFITTITPQLCLQFQNLFNPFIYPHEIWNHFIVFKKLLAFLLELTIILRVNLEVNFGGSYIFAIFIPLSITNVSEPVM